ncbi:MAG: (2Fe-2S)-binding protein [Dehalococcoidia bacterium]
MYACICRAITEAEVRRAGRAGVTSCEDLITFFGLRERSCCGRCLRQVDRFVRLAADGQDCADAGDGAIIPLTPVLVAGIS